MRYSLVITFRVSRITYRAPVRSSTRTALSQFQKANDDFGFTAISRYSRYILEIVLYWNTSNCIMYYPVMQLKLESASCGFGEEIIGKSRATATGEPMMAVRCLQRDVLWRGSRCHLALVDFAIVKFRGVLLRNPPICHLGKKGHAAIIKDEIGLHGAADGDQEPGKRSRMCLMNGGIYLRPYSWDLVQIRELDVKEWEKMASFTWETEIVVASTCFVTMSTCAESRWFLQALKIFLAEQ